MRFWQSVFSSGVAVAFLGVLSVSALGAVESGGDKRLFAKVDDEVITRADYEAAMHAAMRQRFFHGRSDDERMLALRYEVAEQLIDRVLLLDETRRRGVKVDETAVQKGVEHDTRRFRLDGMTEERKKQIKTMLRQQAREQAMVAALESEVKSVSVPAEDEVRAFYKEHQDKFTTPPQWHLSVILLKVAPSAPVAAWDAARKEALKLMQRLDAGADFSELAQLHSGDASAERGGDLGFVHKGMLGAEAQNAVDNLNVGEVSGPVMLLQGVALFKLVAARPAVINPFDRVSVRASGLLQRERGEQAWGRLLESLRAKAQIEIFDNVITTTKMWRHESKTSH